MRVLVAGAGAVGSWIGGNLAAGGATVTLVARGAHAAVMAAEGLRLESGEHTICVQPSVALSVAAAAAGGSFDCTVVAVKSYDTIGLARELADAGTAPRVVSFQNGVGNEAVLASKLPNSVVIPATLTTAVHIRRPGVVMAWHKGGVGLGVPPHGDISDLAAHLRRGGHSVGLYPDADDMKWSKLLLNMLAAASSAILGWAPPLVLADRRLFDLEHTAWLEALAVMRSLGRHPVVLPGYRVDLFARLAPYVPPSLLHPFVHWRVGRERGERLPSATHDLAQGRTRTEIEVLNGAVACAGERAGVPVPVNRSLTDLVTALAAGTLRREDFAGHPEAVLERVLG